ncbi:uncharacterized protein CDV56_103656 [Aspergillus thermomutatus]|uniref:Uncharacterized protein n=1 Tax=Aspergillus thermomutatus TaxID=41047 RepID=A0A397GUQ1_ASPTH|nr:uncharacterized protein CDV56_103656 [Aspergillus thermomutatus]RHZ51790.1 hypothetical protein CDV56_103656 [Aspergillus thermomutatus]
MTHWWETRGFSQKRATVENGPEKLYDHKGEFQDQVLDALTNGRRKDSMIYHESLSEHSDMTNVRGYFMAPANKNARLLYPKHIERIKQQVEEILIGPVAWQETSQTSYIPRSPEDFDLDEHKNGPKGAALVRYTDGAAWPLEVFLEDKVFKEKRSFR